MTIEKDKKIPGVSKHHPLRDEYSVSGDLVLGLG